MEKCGALSYDQKFRSQRLVMKYLVTINDDKYRVSIDGDRAKFKIDGREVKIDYRRLKGGKLHSIIADNIAYEFSLERSNGGFDVWHACGQSRVDVTDEKSERLTTLMGTAVAGSKASSLKAPMPGLVIKVEVKVGQHVKRGDGLVIVEAMKMENELKAHAPAIIKEIKVQAGQAVEKNQILILFE